MLEFVTDAPWLCIILLAVTSAVSCHGPGSMKPATPSWRPGSSWKRRKPPAKQLRMATLPRPRRVWQKVDFDAAGMNLATPRILADEQDFVVTASEIIRRDPRTGQTIERVTLGPEIRDMIIRSATQVVSDGGRVAIDFREGAILTWRDPTRPQVLRLPFGMIGIGLAGDLLLLRDVGRRVTSAYDLAHADPPLAALDHRAALAALRDEAGPYVVDLVCDALSELDGLDDEWFAIAQKRDDPLWTCALKSLPPARQKESGTSLRALALQTKDPATLAAALSALAQDDDWETTTFLVGMTKRPRPKDFRETLIWEKYADAARDQVWRTGRASRVGWCPATPRSRPATELQRKALDGAIGTAHPLLFQNVSPTGSWCLFCQARADTTGDGSIDVSVAQHGELAGDHALPYLAAGSGEGWAIDEFVGADPLGRYVAVRNGACLEIVDLLAASGPTITTLPEADLRDNGILGPHRGADFDPHGKRMLYLRSGATSQVVIRDLSTGHEESRDIGPGLIEKARFDPQGPWIQMTVVPSGEWPTIFTSLAPRICRGSPASFSIMGRSDKARIVRRLLSVDGRTDQSGDDLVGPFGYDVLRRTSDGAITIASVEGKRTVLVPAECGASLRHADAERRTVIVTCDASEDEHLATLWLFRPDGGYGLAGGEHVPEDRYWMDRPDRVVEADYDVHVDVELARVVPAPTAPRLARDEFRILRGPASSERGDYAERGDGRVLRAEVPAKRWGEIPLGPLRWVRP